METLEVAQYVGCVLIAQLAILLERLVDDVLQLGGQRRVEPRRGHRRLAENPFEDHRRGRAGKWLRASRHLVQHDAERKEIGARVEVESARLLRRHVRDRADGRAAVGDVGGGDGDAAVTGRFLIARRKLGEAEIQHLCLASARDEDVCRLDVAVDDAARVGGIQRVGDVNAQFQEVVDGQGPLADAMLQRPAVEQLHHEEPLAVVLADVEERADVGVIQRRGDACLALEAFDRLRIARQLRREEFDGNLPAEPRVLGAIDHSHAAAAEFFDDAVV